MPLLGVKLEIQEKHVVLDNGIVQVTLSKPDGHVSGIRYNDIDNLLETRNEEGNRGYWDLVWSQDGATGTTGIFEIIKGTTFRVILETEEQIELSFSRSWDSSVNGKLAPLNIDKRFVMLRGSSGFYSYGVYERLEDWPGFNLDETRIAFKLRKDKFHYMAMADNRQRYMPLPDDRLPARGQALAYPEAVLLVNPVEPDFKGEVDDKYQYSCENKDLKVHGWICMDPHVGFWQITPSNEYRSGGPLKQNLTSHVGPTTLAMFLSAHYAGEDLVPKFKQGERWKKVFGPVFIYLNSKMEEEEDDQSHLALWEDAKEQMQVEVQSWPYSFPVSEDFQSSALRGRVSGRLLVQDSNDIIKAKGANVGLAIPGDVGSWQRECKRAPKMEFPVVGVTLDLVNFMRPNCNYRTSRDQTVLCVNFYYQFWTVADEDGYFSINDIITGEYAIYAFVPGFIGDYRSDSSITISSGSNIALGDLVFKPPRDGPTLWEIGIPDRSAREFFVPDPDNKYINKLFVNHPDRFRQYGLWERYSELYPDGDLIFTVGESDYTKDWFFAHVTRKRDDNNGYQGTTWQIRFTLDNVNSSGTYKLRLSLASAALAQLQVRINDSKRRTPLFSSGLIGKDNAIARHGIHGLNWLFNVDIEGTLLVQGDNTIYLTQANGASPFQGVMYDYIRLEAPSS